MAARAPTPPLRARDQGCVPPDTWDAFPCQPVHVWQPAMAGTGTGPGWHHPPRHRSEGVGEETRGGGSRAGMGSICYT